MKSNGFSPVCIFQLFIKLILNTKYLPFTSHLNKFEYFQCLWHFHFEIVSVSIWEFKTKRKVILCINNDIQFVKKIQIKICFSKKHNIKFMRKALNTFTVLIWFLPIQCVYKCLVSSPLSVNVVIMAVLKWFLPSVCSQMIDKVAVG